MDARQHRGMIGAIACLIMLAVWMAKPAHAQTCGYAQCELYMAANPNGPGVGGSQECRDDTEPLHGGFIALWYKPTWNPAGYHFSHFAKCNCAAQPDLPAGDGAESNRPGGGRCMAGCLFKPKPGYWTSTTDPFSGRVFVNSENGWTSDGGANCNSYGPGAGNDDKPVPDPIACDDGVCIKPSEPPAFCGEINGQKICADNGECEGNAPSGYVCVGPPDANTPSPPVPPDGPAPARPPDLDSPCIINGVPCEIRQWKPPFGDAPCPEGWTRDSNGNCVRDEEQPDPPECPDGRPPQNGACPAPYADCADGTRPQGNPPRCIAPMVCPDGTAPVRGQCPPVNGVCPGGSQPINGQCTAQLGACPNGQPPVAGQCQPGYANCPNGAQPINGQCSAGGACDPATDPAGCEGADEGNAGGGGTCEAEPFCSGDLILCNVLSQQWRTRCAIENMTGGEVTTDGTTGESPDDTAGVREADGAGLIGQINESAFLGGGGSCPEIPSFTAFGSTYSFSEWEGWCQFLIILGGIIYAMGSFMAIRIVVGD